MLGLPKAGQVSLRTVCVAGRGQPVRQWVFLEHLLGAWHCGECLALWHLHNSPSAHKGLCSDEHCSEASSALGQILEVQLPLLTVPLVRGPVTEKGILGTRGSSRQHHVARWRPGWREGGVTAAILLTSWLFKELGSHQGTAVPG